MQKTITECLYDHIWLPNSGQLALWLTFTYHCWSLEMGSRLVTEHRKTTSGCVEQFLSFFFFPAHFWGEHSRLIHVRFETGSSWLPGHIHPHKNQSHPDPVDLFRSLHGGLMLPKPHIPFTLTHTRAHKHTHPSQNHTRCMDINTIIRHPTQPGSITRGLTHKHHCPHELDEVISTKLLQWVMLRLPCVQSGSSCNNTAWPLLQNETLSCHASF